MKHEVAVIGGGIVGLATAYYVTEKYPGRSVIVVEKEDDVARHQTRHNSGVIHSGIYYRPGSLMAENCRIGRDALVDFCEREHVAFDVCGKVIVAVEEQERAVLRGILERGRANGIRCELIGADALRDREPYCAGIEAVLVPDAGIVDFAAMARRMAEIVVGRGHAIRTRSEVVGIVSRNAAVFLETTTGPVEADVVVNCGGLYADRLARMSGAEPGVLIVPFRGEYYELHESARHLCRHLIYPVPDPEYPFLGVHFTPTVDGRVECGPSAVMAFAREGYRFGSINYGELMEAIRFKGFRRLAARNWKRGVAEIFQSLSKRRYLSAARRLLPELGVDDLLPSPSGVRALALRPDGSFVDDFLILESGRMVNVCNAPSPAATAALNIGRLIGEKVAARF